MLKKRPKVSATAAAGDILIVIHVDASQAKELKRRHKHAAKFRDALGRQPYKDMTFEQFIMSLVPKDMIMEEARRKWPLLLKRK